MIEKALFIYNLKSGIQESITRRFLALFLASLMALPAGFAQTTPPATQNSPAASDVPASPLTIQVIEGNNAINSIPLLRSVTPIIEVRDGNDLPVEGASVTFTMPEHGPGGRFTGDRISFTTRSDARGQAAAPFVVNSTTGKFQIKVTVTAGNRKGEATITQTNSTGGYIGVEKPPAHWYKKWYWWAIIGGAGTGVVIALTRGGSSSNTITFTPGGAVIGGPQ